MQNKQQTKSFIKKSRKGFQRIFRGPKQGFLTGSFHHRAFQGFTSGLNKKKFTSTPFKVMGLRY